MYVRSQNARPVNKQLNLEQPLKIKIIPAWCSTVSIGRSIHFEKKLKGFFPQYLVQKTVSRTETVDPEQERNNSEDKGDIGSPPKFYNSFLIFLRENVKFFIPISVGFCGFLSLKQVFFNLLYK